jgi:hypothetical protein
MNFREINTRQMSYLKGDPYIQEKFFKAFRRYQKKKLLNEDSTGYILENLLSGEVPGVESYEDAIKFLKDMQKEVKVNG